MKIYSKKPKGQRIFKSTIKYRPIWVEPIDSNWWFDLDTNVQKGTKFIVHLPYVVYDFIITK